LLDLWRFLGGNVPGGFSLLLVAVIAFLLVWRHVYRVGQTLKDQNYRRWRWRVPLIFLLIYFIAWIQSPPKIPPLRIAVIPGSSPGGHEWECAGTADLTARQLSRAIKGAVINPWEGAKDYSQPNPDVLQKAGYRVFQISCVSLQTGKTFLYTISNLSGAHQAFPATEHAMVDLSALMCHWTLSQLGKKQPLSSAFYRNVSAEVLESYYQGRQALLSGELDAAQAALEAALRMDAHFWPAAIYLGRVYETEGRKDSALAAYMEAARADTGSMEALLALGEYYLRIFEWEAGEAALKIVLAKSPTSSRAMAGLARIHPERLKDLRLNSPQELLEEATRLDPAYARARLQLADQLADQGFPESARKLLFEGLDFDPVSIDLLLKLGAIELQLGHPEAARQAYETILKKDPLNAIGLFNLGVVDYRTKQYDQAIRRFEAVQGLQGPVDCYYYLGLIYQSQGDPVRAKFYFQKRWELRSSDEDAFAVKARDLASQLEDKNVK